MEIYGQENYKEYDQQELPKRDDTKNTENEILIEPRTNIKTKWKKQYKMNKKIHDWKERTLPS